MGKNRRNFLKIAGVSALCLGAKPVMDVFASSESHNAPKAEYHSGEKALTGKKWGLVIDTTKFESAAELMRKKR